MSAWATRPPSYLAELDEISADYGSVPSASAIRNIDLTWRGSGFVFSLSHPGRAESDPALEASRLELLRLVRS